MIITLYCITLLIIIILTIFLVVLLIAILDSIINGHDIHTSKCATKKIIGVISKYPDHKEFYDLGSAYGNLSIKIKAEIPRLSVTAIDNNCIRIFISKILARIYQKKINFKMSDIFTTNLSDANIIYAYLWHDNMSVLEKKLQNELKPGSIVITNTSRFPNWKPIDIIRTDKEMLRIKDFETLFIYQKM